MLIDDLGSLSSRRLVKRASLLLVALGMVAGTPFVLTLMGCGGSMGRTSSGTTATSVRGAVTIENRSTIAICGLSMQYQGGYAAQEVDLGPGASVQIDVQGDTNRLYLTECGGARSLLGHPMNWYGTPQGATELLSNLGHDRIVLYDPGQAPAGASDHRAIALNPRPISDWIFWQPHPDAELAAELHAALLDKARSEGWRETLEFSLLLGDWSPIRNRRTGIITGRSVQAAGFARWPDGHCTMQAFGYEQGYDGSDYGGPIRVGASTQLDIPCAVLPYAAGLPGASPSSIEPVSSGGRSATSAAPASGGRCADTCRTAHDGECDDGGPGALYDVCALGTDCSDCGAR